MNRILGYFKQVLAFFGFKRNSKYVRHYLDESNLLSGALMALVIIALEIWLIIRQHNKYIIDIVAQGGNYWDALFNYTSNFWLFLLVGFSMLMFCLTALPGKKRPHLRFWLNVGFSGMLFLYSFFAFKETYKWNQPRQVIASVFLILLYAFSNLLALSVIGYNLYVRWKGRESDKLSMICITLFAVICLVFGMKVSYSDFSSSSEPKMIICFLTMVLYVACLLVWKPYLSIILLGAIFYGFVLMLETWAGNREFFQGDRVNYITFYISLVMVAITLYQQRLKDATKAEALENKAVFDDLTSLHNYAHFQQEVAVFVSESNPQAGEYIYLYIDPDGFKSVNDTLGFAKGNEFLIELGQKIAGQFGDRLTARVSDDRFVAFAPVVDLEKKLAVLSDEVSAMGGELHTQLKVGGYLYRDPEESPRRAIDKARYACATVKHRNDRHYQEYDKKMHDSYHTLQYVTNHIDEAVANGWVRPYYQPVVFSSGRELCGVEAIARWIDPKCGFLNRGQFIPVLEDT
ncbi:MAG: diguanylate cyclase, partial [Bacilli bacterium]|nr:diguanylate cyclase [Bacilli bacterium]